MNAVDALLAGLVDYAGLFPPAGLEMRQAVESYAAYLASSEREILGRFILPLARVEEFERIARAFLPSEPESEPWRLSVLVGGDTAGAARQMLEFNDRHTPLSESGNALIEVVELKAQTPDAVKIHCSALPAVFTAYVELPLGRGVTDLVEAVSSVGARAKIRTGGTTPDSFPRAQDVVDFMVACKRFNVAFKATAGLHHPLRGAYRLTYEPAAAEGTMYGYLNLFVAAALVYRGGPEKDVLDALVETDAAAFSFSDTAVEWRGIEIPTAELRAVRENFANSFGSCSFREPVDEIRELTSIASK